MKSTYQKNTNYLQTFDFTESQSSCEKLKLKNLIKKSARETKALIQELLVFVVSTQKETQGT